jgi:hypothetical protein
MGMALRLLLPLVLFAVLVASAGASFEPRFCGQVRAHHHKYDVKADIRCKKARRYMKAYMVKGHKPKGWSCHHYTGSSQEYRCDKGSRSMFTNRR